MFQHHYQRLMLVTVFCLLAACVPITPAPSDETPAETPQSETPQSEGTPAAGATTEAAESGPAGYEEQDLVVLLSSPEWEPRFEDGPFYENPGGIVVTQPLDGEDEEGPYPETAYVADQLLLTGPAADINSLINIGNEDPDITARIGKIEPIGSPISPVTEGVSPEDIVTLPVRFDGGATLAPSGAEILQELAVNRRLAVVVEPNYILSVNAPHAAEGACGSPMSGEASPMSGEASPFIVDGPLTVDTMMDYFWEQWALGPAEDGQGGIGLVENGQRGDYPTGADSVVYILDTSPFDASGVYSFAGEDWARLPLKLHVTHPVQAIWETPDAERCALSDHGLFVAGLVHAVAPDAELHLVKVLDDNGRGDLGGILFALSNLAQSERTRMVINMSFGLHRQSPIGDLPPLEEICAALEEATGISLDGCQDPIAVLEALRDGSDQIDEELYRTVLKRFGTPMLITVMRMLIGRDAVVVAASGNRANKEHARFPQIPASYAMSPQYAGSTVAVAGSTDSRERAFFSHRGTGAAPSGGDNGPSCPQSGENLAVNGCWQGKEDFIVSVIVDKRVPPPAYTFGYWVGTSFATPLVAGMAAALHTGSGADTVTTVLSSVCPGPAAAPQLGNGVICFNPTGGP